MTAVEATSIAMLGLAFAGGLRSTIRLWRLWRRDEETRRSLILAAFAWIALVITSAAAFFGALAVRRALGFQPFPWSPLVSVVVASIVLFIPIALDWLVDRIASERR